MPTHNRRRFAPQAIKYFLEQDYPHKELLIVDDGADRVADLVPSHPQLKYIALPKKTSLGAKRNLAIEASTGEIILHWDDDDWHARHRIRYQVEQLAQSHAEICGISKLLFWDLRSQRLWLYEYPVQQKFWLAGGTLCYAKSFWKKNPFEDLSVGEDTRFVWKKKIEHALLLPDFRFYVAMIHAHNTSPKSLKPPYWRSWDEDDLPSLVQEDWKFYASRGDLDMKHILTR